MGFNKRKMEDQRRQVAEREAAVRRATDTKVLEDAERLIASSRRTRAGLCACAAMRIGLI
jgi:hypothetical protein